MFDTTCCVYTCRRLIDLSVIAGTVMEAKKKGVLVAFDGNAPDWQGCFDVIELEQEPFEEMIRADDLKKVRRFY